MNRFHDGGTIRTTVLHEDGEEYVLLNNFNAIISRFCTDASGNKFGADFYLPPTLWETLDAQMKSEHGLDINTLRKNKAGGIVSLVDNCTFYRRRHGIQLFIYSPHNDLWWRLKIGETHELIRKSKALELVGINKGFDMIVPYHPKLGYAPPQLLLAWAKEGYTQAKDTLRTIALMPRREQLQICDKWEAQGHYDARDFIEKLGLMAPEDLKLLGKTEPF